MVVFSQIKCCLSKEVLPNFSFYFNQIHAFASIKIFYCHLFSVHIPERSGIEFWGKIKHMLPGIPRFKQRLHGRHRVLLPRQKISNNWDRSLAGEELSCNSTGWNLLKLIEKYYVITTVLLLFISRYVLNCLQYLAHLI